ncbi:hypothetical protein [Geodermatophilus sp. TF02-6]|uniref:hypothetical protein n=1 Tax=Geodermatophilus sp. TF02-6 TaxID=2250575 RepID=UPI0018F4E019|nr:hypothetical protein [Geodermatophilus sp. TF02-6]
MPEAPRTPSPSTTELPPVPPTGATPAGATSGTGGHHATGPTPVGAPPAPPQTAEAPPAGIAPTARAGSAEGHQPTGPVPSRSRVGPRRPSPLTRMGPWAPVAGAVAGLLAGLVVTLLLGGVAEAFSERLSLVFLTVGLAMLGASGALLADEVRLVRRGAREAGVRPAWVEATANLVNGLTPARLLLLASAFVLFLAAYVS